VAVAESFCSSALSASVVQMPAVSSFVRTNQLLTLRSSALHSALLRFHCLHTTHAVAMSMLAGPKYVTRTLTNVMTASANFTAAVIAPEGFTVTVRPSSFVAAPGESTTVRIRIQKSSVNTAYNVWQTGSITWVGSGGTSTRIPLVVRAAQLASRPTEVKLKAWQPSYSYLVEPEWNGVLATANTGLVASQVYSGSIASWDYMASIKVTLPPGVWSYVRFATFNDDVSGE
jgi:hypothetical protein